MSAHVNPCRNVLEQMLRRGDGLSPERPLWIARAPGRLDVMGGNVDYSGGLVLQIPTRESIWAAFQPTSEPILRLFNPAATEFGGSPTIEAPISVISSLQSIDAFCAEDPARAWTRYVFGAMHLLRERFGCLTHSGGSLALLADLPANRGVASSAALVIAILRAIATSHQIELTGLELATAGQWVENVAVQSACGIMDHAAIVFGVQDALLPILCQPCLVAPPLRLPRGVRVWGVDSMVPRSTRGTAYERARAATFMGYKLVCKEAGVDVFPDKAAAIPRWVDHCWHGYLSNLTPSEFRIRHEQRLPDEMTGAEFLREAGEHIDPFTSLDPGQVYPVRAAVRYAVEENGRIAVVRSLLKLEQTRKDPRAVALIGELFLQSHQAYRSCGLGSDNCDVLVELACHFGFAGAKLTGGGAGGVVAILGFDGQEPALSDLVDAYTRRAGLQDQPHIFRGSSEGVDRESQPRALHPVAEGARQ